MCCRADIVSRPNCNKQLRDAHANPRVHISELFSTTQPHLYSSHEFLKMPTEKICSNCRLKQAPWRGEKCQTPNQGAAFNALSHKINKLTEKVTEVQNWVNIIESPPSHTDTQAKVNSAATDEATSATLILMKTSGCQQESGRDKTAAECVSVTVEWPHCHVFRGADRHPAKYDDLTILKFVAGYMKKIVLYWLKLPTLKMPNLCSNICLPPSLTTMGFHLHKFNFHYILFNYILFYLPPSLVLANLLTSPKGGG